MLALVIVALATLALVAKASSLAKPRPAGSKPTSAPVTGTNSGTNNGPALELARPAAPTMGSPFSGFAEFQADCKVTGFAKDDPIVFPKRPGVSHEHMFVGAHVDAFTTVDSLEAGTNTCINPKDRSAYWMPTLFSNGVRVSPANNLIVYYKSGIKDYGKVQPFPVGLRLLGGYANAKSAAESFGRYSCGSYHDLPTFPVNCPANGLGLFIRLKAPSCWDGIHLDTPNHRDHMAYPTDGVCPPDHPVPVPMLEFKFRALHLEGSKALLGGSDMGLSLSSGGGFTFHIDYINAWNAAEQARLVAYCINGGRQCNEDGNDLHKP